MRYLLSGFLMIGLVSCVTGTDKGHRQEISGLTDMSIEYIQEQWGEAEYVLPKTSGKLVKYKNILYKDEDPITELVEEKLCTVSLMLDNEGIVQDWNDEECRYIGKAAAKAQSEAAAPEEDFDIEDERKLPDLPMAPGE